MTFRKSIVTSHRWIGLVAAVFWLLQALTGIFAVFHWEIDDATLAGPHRKTDFKALERNLTNLAPPGSGRIVDSVWTTAGAADRYDVTVVGPPVERVFRVDGEGNVLRARDDGERFAGGGFVETVVLLHQKLLLGDRGKIIVGISGVLLFSNLLLGITAAWPRAGQWRSALRPSSSASRVARLYSWHRAIGLWAAIPALFLVAAGVLMAFEHTTEHVLNAARQSPIESPTAPSRVGMAQAVEAARARYPAAAVSGIDFPWAESAMWRITLKQEGEHRRAYGKTRVFVSAIDGRIVAEIDAVRAAPGLRFFNILFPFHTGEAGGTAGRVFVSLIGVWLITMIFLGVSLWSARRRNARAARL